MNIFAFFTQIGPLVQRAQSAIARGEAIIAQLETAVSEAEAVLAKLLPAAGAAGQSGS